MCKDEIKYYWVGKDVKIHTRYIINVDRDVSFQAIAWIQAFMKFKFPHFYLFSAHFGGY